MKMTAGDMDYAFIHGLLHFILPGSWLYSQLTALSELSGQFSFELDGVQALTVFILSSGRQGNCR